jgi:ribosomal protein S1
MTLTVWIAALAILSLGPGPCLADNPMSGKEATPTLKERIKRDTVKGTVTRMEGEYYYIRDDDGQEQKIHVDKSTKMDKVKVGDVVKAYITDVGHTTTLQLAD